jgi:DNA repair protein RecO (recombination protein O)
MIHKTSSISLSYIRYKETSIIARFFTETFGIQSFVVNGIRSSRSKISLSLFQPLGLCDLVQYHDEKKDLNRLKEIQPSHILKSIPFSPHKSAIAIFIAEYLGKVVSEGQPNDELFLTVQAWIIDLDSKPDLFDSMHISLVWNSLGPLGIMPNDWKDILPASARPNSEQLAGLQSFFEWITFGGETIQVSGAMKQWILDVLVYYVGTHLEGVGNLKSLKVLRQVFS